MQVVQTEKGMEDKNEKRNFGGNLTKGKKKKVGMEIIEDTHMHGTVAWN